MIRDGRSEIGLVSFDKLGWFLLAVREDDAS